RRLGSLVLPSLCSVLWPDKQTYKETGYWSVTVFGRKHCYRLYTEHLNEAVHWVCAVQKVIDSKAPVQTPTQLLMRDVEEHCGSPEVLEQIYRCNPILRYTSSPLYAPLLPFPYGNLDQSGEGQAGGLRPGTVGAMVGAVAGQGSVQGGTESRFPASEMAKYACFIREALGKTKGRECVPSLEEILVLMRRQEMICTVQVMIVYGV
ncbi:pleckstrin homology domain-containing family H member 3, partial [Egretta garzetta]|uniref:pleckstrin homology domain-containing family H member 3 n=1 Tax=Egretta garzetta TaxID=188379 RepID=UPI00163B98B6